MWYEAVNWYSKEKMTIQETKSVKWEEEQQWKKPANQSTNQTNRKQQKSKTNKQKTESLI